MIQITPQMRILVAIEAVDGRKGIDSLARLCQEKLQADPFSGCLVFFRSRRGTSIRILVYDGQGFWLAQKRLWYEFFLLTGMREQEVMYTYWSDVNLAHATVRVSHKPDRGWTPKAYKEREIPIPAKLAKSLKAWKAKADKTCGLVFPTAGCKPKLDFLDCLKGVAESAKLEEDNFWLHKFRATFATRCLWAGVDLRTVQQWLGHSDMESTMRYLKPSRSQHVRDKVNEIFA
jgi:integrase